MEQGGWDMAVETHARRGRTQIIIEVDMPDHSDGDLQLQQLSHSQVQTLSAAESDTRSNGSASQLHKLAFAVQQDILPQLFSSGRESKHPMLQPSGRSQKQPGSPATLQLQGNALVLTRTGHAAPPRIQAGPTSKTTATAAASPETMPPVILRLTPAAVPTASEHQKSVVLHLQLSSPVQDGAMLLAFHAGRTSAISLAASMHVAGSEACAVDVEYELPQQAGLVQLSIMHDASGLMGPAAPLLVVPHATAAQELCCVQQSTAGVSRPHGGKAPAHSQWSLSHAGHPFLVDFGRWTGDACTHRAAMAAGSTAVESGYGTEAQAGAVGKALQVGNGLLQFCLMAGLPSCLAVIANLLVEAFGVAPAVLLHSCGPSEWLELPVSSSGSGSREVGSFSSASLQLSLLHQAVRYGNLQVVDALVTWAKQHGSSLDWQLPGPEGVTPMDLAEVLPDGGAMLQLIRDTTTSSDSGSRQAGTMKKLGDSQPASSREEAESDVASGPSTPAAAGRLLRDLPSDLQQNAADSMSVASEAHAACAATVSVAGPADVVADSAGRSVCTTAAGFAAGTGDQPAGISLLWAALNSVIFIAAATHALMKRAGLSPMALVHLPYFLILLHGLYNGHWQKGAGQYSFVATSSQQLGGTTFDWLLGRNLGTVLHLYRLFILVCRGIQQYVWPTAITLDKSVPMWYSFVVVPIAQAVEVDFRAAAYVICLLQIPVWYILYRFAYKVAQPVVTVLAQAVLLFAVHSVMGLTRAAIVARKARHAGKAQVGTKQKQH